MKPKRSNIWRESHRKVQKTFSIPLDLKEMLDAHKNPSEALTTILETHRVKVGDGTYDELINKEYERLALEVETELRNMLPVILKQILGTVVDKIIEERYGNNKTKSVTALEAKL